MLLTTRSTRFSSLATSRDRNLRAWSDERISSNREMTSSIVGRFSGLSCTMSSMRDCINSTPWYLCKLSEMSNIDNDVSFTTYLQEVFADEIPDVIDVRWKWVAGIIRLVEFWHRLVAAEDGRLSGRQVCRPVLPRYAEVDKIVLRRMRCSRMMLGGMREVAIPFNDARVIGLGVQRFRVHHEVLVHAVPDVRQSAIAVTVITVLPMCDMVLVHELQALQKIYSASYIADVEGRAYLEYLAKEIYRLFNCLEWRAVVSS